jgi:hypothetical protein
MYLSGVTDRTGGGFMDDAKKDDAQRGGGRLPGDDRPLGGNRPSAGNRPLAGVGRREFIGAAAAALFAGVVIQITGCSDEDPASSQGGGDVTGYIEGNHPAPHRAVITKAVVDAGGALDLDIQGLADHSHTVSLTAVQMATIKAKQHVMLDSSSGGSDSHVHMVMFN